MNHSNFARLKHIHGALSGIRTKTGRRRRDDGNDSDSLIASVDPFLADRVRKVAKSKAFRRLAQKTQVITDADNAHIRTRASHTHEVAANSALVAEFLGLNTSLAEAIAYGHDIGHTPFGHAGETVLTEIAGRPFRHEVMGVVIAQHIERQCTGLNLTHETLSGMHQHSRGRGEMKVSERMTPEASVVMYCDKLTYVLSDYSDFQRIGLPIQKELITLMDSLGGTQRMCENRLLSAFLLESAEKNDVVFQACEEAQIFKRIKALMYELYERCNAFGVDAVLWRIHEFIKKTFGHDTDPVLVLALMTDRDIIHLCQTRTLDLARFRETSVWELLPDLAGKQIEWWNPDLQW